MQWINPKKNPGYPLEIPGEKRDYSVISASDKQAKALGVGNPIR